MRALELGLAPSERIEKIQCDFLATAATRPSKIIFCAGHQKRITVPYRALGLSP